jgi:hypothetical protein
MGFSSNRWVCAGRSVARAGILLEVVVARGETSVLRSPARFTEKYSIPLGDPKHFQMFP